MVEDQTTDRTFRILRSIPGLITLKRSRIIPATSRWRRKISAFNRGALVARGDYLAFLDQTVRVTPGWLTALAQTFEDVPGTALAGAKLVLPDGRLLEAGAALSPEGDGLSYGKFDDARHPRYNFARKVDYCSTGCLMVPRTLFLKLGRYEAGAREEIDLASRIRDSGHKVIYQPLARVIQHEPWRAAGLAPSKFDAHWPDRHDTVAQQPRRKLASYPADPGAIARSVSGPGTAPDKSRRILVIDHRLPFPDRDSGSVRMIGGLDYPPNVDAVLFFAREIFPQVHERIPVAVFKVIGNYPSPEISDLASPSVHILGFVPDVKPLFDRAGVGRAAAFRRRSQRQGQSEHVVWRPHGDHCDRRRGDVSHS